MNSRSSPNRRLVIERARTLRREATDAERRLWAALRNRQLHGYRFRRQFPIDPYIADFCCVERMLVVELDGGQHQQRERYDSARTHHLRARGFKVLRFWNADVLRNVEGTCDAIREALGANSEGGCLS